LSEDKTSNISPPNILTPDVVDYHIPGAYISANGTDCQASIVERAGWRWLYYCADRGRHIGDSPYLDTNLCLKENKTRHT